MKTYYWDFFGPNAEPTARHFMKHLDELIIQNNLGGCTTGVSSDGDEHYAAWCRAPEDMESAIERSLAPKRMLED